MNQFGITVPLFPLLNDSSNGVYVTFQTSYCDFNFESDPLLVSYLGSMTLSFTKNVPLNSTGDFTLGKNDAIQCVYSFSDASFSNPDSTSSGL
ncbi:hypothetical protein FACS1894218_5990 [Bacilli bacterium]|nr:hypothetical protein FACS1894218_5990 [Bacilli bacterium]